VDFCLKIWNLRSPQKPKKSPDFIRVFFGLVCGKFCEIGSKMSLFYFQLDGYSIPRFGRIER